MNGMVWFSRVFYLKNPNFLGKLFILLIINIILGIYMGETEKLDKLYEDAIYWHLIAQGYSDYVAKMEAQRRTKIKESL